MPTEEDLDHLIDQHVSGENQLSPIDDEIAALLAAAKRLVQLQEIEIPPSLLIAWKYLFVLVPTFTSFPSGKLGVRVQSW